MAKRADWMDGVCVCVCVCVHIYNLNTSFPIDTISVPLYKWARKMYHFSISGFRHWIIDIELLKIGRLKLSFFVSNWNEEIFIKFEMSIILEMIFHSGFTFSILIMHLYADSFWNFSLLNINFIKSILCEIELI